MGMNNYDTWLKVGGSFRCGCCLRMPTFVDIRDLKVCPHCQHIMNWYETDHGSLPMRNQEGEEQHVDQEEE